ncbi:MAG TPA: MlaD family protein [Conexibacter sp.]|jgi:phospholipid/cholesterol/gamma-HCH transport system substrate-binding protein|nr:MlaD family protein [Conexibacter sp.]
MARHAQPSARKPPRWSRFRVGLLAIVLIAIASYFGFTKAIPFTHGYRLHAVFESSNNLRPGSPVRIAGVNVGKVKSVDRYKDTNLTDVTMEIDQAGLPIHRDATLKIRPRIFLEGNFFVDLKPGSPSAPDVPENGTIGPTQTATPVQLDELFTALQSDQRADLQVLLQQFGKALSSQPTVAQDATLPADVRGKTGAQGLNESYTYAPDALKGSALVNSALLGTQPHDLSRMIASIARLTTALRTRESALQGLIVNFNTTAGAFAAQSGALQSAVGLLGPTLTTADAAFKSLDASFPATRGFARDFLPAVQETPATVQAAFPWIAQTRALLRPDELGGLLAQLQPATADLARLEGASLSFLPQLDLANRCFARVIIPAGDIGVQDGALTNRRADGSIVENYKEFWYSMVGLAGESANFDGNGSAIRTALGGGSQAVNNGVSRSLHSPVIGNANFKPLGTSPLYPATQPPYMLDAPCDRNALPNVNGPQAGPGRAPPSIVSPTPAPMPNPGTPSTTATAGAGSVETSGARTSRASTDAQLLSRANPLQGATR